MSEFVSIALLAFVLDLLMGDPPYKYHPIRIIGRSIVGLESALRRMGWNGKGGGVLLVLVLGIAVTGFYIVLFEGLSRIHLWLPLLFNLYLCYSCLALGDLLNHVKPVIRYLEQGQLNQARKAVGMVVGRNVDALDGNGIGRAAVETLAENFVDGFVSPLLWYLLGGVLASILNVSILKVSISCMLLFKLASTLDSMVGYRNEKYTHFGWAGARLDDLMNFVPARISVFLLFLGAAVSGLRPLEGLKTALRDRLKHDSPNAGHSESFVAGALGVRLGGPIKYPKGTKNKPWLGDGRSDVGPETIYRTGVLVRRTGWILVMAFLSAFFVI